MGVEYTIANHRNKTLFDLGKGSWYDLMCPDKEDGPKTLYRDTFIAHIQDYWREEYSKPYWNMTPEQIEQESISWIPTANHIFDFIEGYDIEKDFTIFGDGGDDRLELELQGYIWLGSRYTWSETYAQDIQKMNRRVKTSIDVGKLDFSLPISRLRKLLVFA